MLGNFTKRIDIDSVGTMSFAAVVLPLLDEENVPPAPPPGGADRLQATPERVPGMAVSSSSFSSNRNGYKMDEGEKPIGGGFVEAYLNAGNTAASLPSTENPEHLRCVRDQLAAIKQWQQDSSKPLTYLGVKRR